MSIFVFHHSHHMFPNQANPSLLHSLEYLDIHQSTHFEAVQLLSNATVVLLMFRYIPLPVRTDASVQVIHLRKIGW